jgi:acetyl-CoA acetyltransferase
VLQALVVLDRAGHRDDPRTSRARQLVAAKRREDGTWRAVRPWWRLPGSAGLVEAVGWGEAVHQMVTLNALRVTAPAGGTPPARVPPSPAPPAGPPAR